MTALGKYFVFYLKYPAEMTRLYWKPEYGGEEPDLTGLEDKERVREMAFQVGQAASRDMADFLEECGKKIEDHFKGLGNVTTGKRAQRSFILRNWYWKVIVRAGSVAGGWFLCGVSVSDQEKIVVPFIWRKGGRAGRDALKARLGTRADSLSAEGLAFYPGAVALARVPIFGNEEPHFQVDQEALVAKVVRAFSVIRADDVEFISRYSRKETDSPESDNPTALE